MVVNLREQISPKDAAQVLSKFESITGGNEEMSKDASAWIQDTIDKLNSFKQRVDDGLVIIMGGDYSETHPVPDIEQVTYDYISLSIDFVKTKSQNRNE